MRRTQRLKPIYLLARHLDSAKSGGRNDTVMQRMEAKAGSKFARAAMRDPAVMCEWCTPWTKEDFKQATQIALTVCSGTDTWDYHGAREAVCAATGKDIDDPVTRMAWGFIGEAIEWQRGSYDLEGSHRLCMARSLGVDTVLAIVS